MSSSSSKIVVAFTCIIIAGYVVFADFTQQSWTGMANKVTLDRARECEAQKRSKLGQCGCQGWNDRNFTVVTALFDIGRNDWPRYRRHYEDYLYYGRQLLSMDINLVIFIEPKGKQFVEEHRRGKEDKTVVHLMDKKDLPYAHLYLKKVQAIMNSIQFKENHEQLEHPEGFSPWYNIVINSKLNLIQNAIFQDHFNSTFYSWIDFGYAHGHEVYPTSRVWAPCNIMTGPVADKITYIQLHNYTPRHIHDVHKKDVMAYINGGFFAGSKNAMLAYQDLFNKVFKRYIEQGIIDDDQTLTVGCYFENSSLFNFVRGDWYDLFTLFH